MKSNKYVGVELLAVLKNKKLLIPIMAVILVPLLYSSLFLWAFWDPYAKLDSLPVAIVNEDKGASFQGKDMKIGEEFIDKIQQTKSFEWHVVTKDEALQGLKDNKYYLGVEIPQDFSAKAMNVLEDHPVAAAFQFYPNEGYNFLSSQIGKTVIDRMKGEISSQLTKAYTETVFTSIHTLSEGLAAAAEGALRLSEGTKSIESGLGTMNENLVKLVEGTQPLKHGVDELLGGADQLNSGLGQLKHGAGQLTSGLVQLTEGYNQLRVGSKQAEEGTVQLENGLEQSLEASSKLNAGMSGLVSGLEQYVALHPESAQDPVLMKLVGTAKTLAGGTDSLVNGQLQLAEGAAKLVDGETMLNESMDIFAQKLGEAKQGSQNVASGLIQLEQGGEELEAGLAQLFSGVEQLSEGSKLLEAGSSKLTSGAITVAKGTDELSVKLKEASDKSSELQGTDAMYLKVANPVEVQEEKLNPVPNYGTGFAPYFVSLGLFVGALLLTIVFPLREPAGSPKSGFALFLGKLGMMLLVGGIQAVIVDVVLLYGLGLEVQSVPLFVLFSLITTWTYMALIQLFVTTLGDPGRFVAIVVLILQLTTSAGTFPVELIPDTLQHITAWLPMTYTVSGYKAVISSGEFGFMWYNASVLGAFALSSSLLTLIYFVVRHKSLAGVNKLAAQSAA
jgi:putative membrane protein